MTQSRFAWILTALLTFATAQASAQTSDDSLSGTWELVAGWVITDQEEIKYDIEGITSRKVLNGTDFAFVSRKKGAFWAASTGEYIVEGDQYTEVPQLLSYEVAEGTTYVFTYRVEGDNWYTERKEDGKVVEREHWRRIR